MRVNENRNAAYAGNTENKESPHRISQRIKRKRENEKDHREEARRKRVKEINNENRISFLSKEFIIIRPNVHNILTLGKSNGRPLGFYLPREKKPTDIGLVEENLTGPQTSLNAASHLPGHGSIQTQRIHVNGNSGLRDKYHHRTVHNKSFFRFLSFDGGIGPQAFTQLYTNKKQNITPIHVGFGGTLVIPTHSRYHSVPTNMIKRLKGSRSIQSLGSYHIPPEKLESLKKMSRPISKIHLYSQTNRTLNPNMRNMRNHTSKMKPSGSWYNKSAIRIN